MGRSSLLKHVWALGYNEFYSDDSRFKMMFVCDMCCHRATNPYRLPLSWHQHMSGNTFEGYGPADAMRVNFRGAYRPLKLSHRKSHLLRYTLYVKLPIVPIIGLQSFEPLSR